MGRVASRKNYRGEVTDSSHILKPRVNPNGYHIVTLYDRNRKPHQIAVHRLVAEAFIPNANRILVIDHVDGNKTNNSVYNLEWVTSRENSIRAYNSGLYEPIFAKTRRPVIVTDLRNGDTTYFEGVNDAARHLRYSAAVISRVANLLQDKVGHYAVEFAGYEDRLLYNKNY